ncbi:hypothetical protein DFQ27_009649 [Actinomortierella ambigua]|uniref:NmrA-like domain-containing protein n=1 Tax=Actinomortierella ambigua TaxID=1343610 RepID=A0A9P6PQL2_9FUNG|nr:hypothetical protein DFQ27_009649 [Actinomortierella ambigua]
MTKFTIFITGQTGYIGGTVVDHLLKNPDAKDKFVYRSLVRSADNAKTIQALGITPVLGSLDDSKLLTDEAAKADVILHFADADHLPAIHAFAKGLLQQGHRHLARPVLIYNSGTGVLLDGAKGAFASKDIYSDDDPDRILALPDSANHRNVELAVLDPKLNEHVDTYIVSPPTIWGTGTGPVHRHSIQIPLLVGNAVKHRKVYRIGKGLNRWSKIHVADLANFYVLLTLKSVHQPNDLPKGRKGYYFVENGEYAFEDVSTITADELHKQGIAQDARVYDTPHDKEGEYWNPIAVIYLGGNSRSRSVIGGKYLGWKATHDLDGKEFEQYIRDEVKRAAHKA